MICRACRHDKNEHSQVLFDAPCLECDCPAFVAVRYPNPTHVSGWRCPFCGGTTVDYGTERRRLRRFGRRRLVHVECPSPP